MSQSRTMSAVESVANVAIGGAQTGVSASPGPSGWNTIGHTDMSFFDSRRTPPSLLSPGDMIRFRTERIIK